MICVGRFDAMEERPTSRPSAILKRRSTQARLAISRQEAGVDASAARRNPREAQSSYWSWKWG